MDRENVVPGPQRHYWEPPVAEEIRVSAEATMYMGVKEDWD
jgi:hypothetical protein